MKKLNPETDNMDMFYNLARKLRQDIRSGDEDLQNATAQRIRIIPGWRSLDDAEIISTAISLKMGKLVIALEHGFDSWGELRTFVGEKELERMEQENLEDK